MHKFLIKFSRKGTTLVLNVNHITINSIIRWSHTLIGIEPGTGWAYLLAWTIQLYHSVTACGAPVHMICPCFLLQSSTKFLQSTTFDYSLNLLNHIQLQHLITCFSQGSGRASFTECATALRGCETLHILEAKLLPP